MTKILMAAAFTALLASGLFSQVRVLTMDPNGNMVWIPLPALAPGTTGVTGATGLVGPQGIQGLQGTAGIGLVGLQGNAGLPGANGKDGLPGKDGGPGLPGPPGPQGSPGSPGPQGSQGLQGFQGILGTVGPVGLTGSTGAAGQSGPQGLQGIQGVTGPAGAAGLTGPQGSPGVLSTLGPSGTVPFSDGRQIIWLNLPVMSPGTTPTMIIQTGFLPPPLVTDIGAVAVATAPGVASWVMSNSAHLPPPPSYPVQCISVGTPGKAAPRGCSDVAIDNLWLHMRIDWWPDNTILGGPTLLGIGTQVAVSVKMSDGVSDPGPNDFIAGRLYQLWYDGKVLRLIR